MLLPYTLTTLLVAYLILLKGENTGQYKGLCLDIPNIIYLEQLRPENKLDAYPLVHECTKCGVCI